MRRSKNLLNIGDRVARATNLDNGMFYRFGDACGPGPLLFGEVVSVTHGEVVSVEFDGYKDPDKSYFNHGLIRVGGKNNEQD